MFLSRSNGPAAEAELTMKNLVEELRTLYSDESKHSIYQNLPNFVVEALGYNEKIDEQWRGDRPRLEFIRNMRSPKRGESWLDFGANTGFFALSLAKEFPETKFVAVEANPSHARFICRIAEEFEIKNVTVKNLAVGIDGLVDLPKVDVMLHLNVLHHAGHDFDHEFLKDRSHFGAYATNYLSRLRNVTEHLFFQMGSNWGGNRMLPIVAFKDDKVKLDVFKEWIRCSGWLCKKTAYASRCGECIQYTAIDEMEIDGLGRSWTFLDAFPGEFYRRPLFFCSPR
jgi:hypothetical protein